LFAFESSPRFSGIPATSAFFVSTKGEHVSDVRGISPFFMFMLR